jgi:hypothetical protein
LASNYFQQLLLKGKITGRGKSIIFFDPNAPMDTPPYWEHHSSTQDGTGAVPAGYMVRVIGAYVKFK